MQQGFPGDGAGGGGRTRTVSPPLDFESSTSANSITPAYILFRTVSKSSLRKSEGDLEGDFEKTRFIRLSKALIYKGFLVSPGETAMRILSSVAMYGLRKKRSYRNQYQTVQTYCNSVQIVIFYDHKFSCIRKMANFLPLI